MRREEDKNKAREESKRRKQETKRTREGNNVILDHRNEKESKRTRQDRDEDDIEHVKIIIENVLEYA